MLNGLGYFLAIFILHLLSNLTLHQQFIDKALASCYAFSATAPIAKISPQAELRSYATSISNATLFFSNRNKKKKAILL